MASCRVMVGNDACGKTAEHIVTFKDGDKVPACTRCMIELRRKAGAAEKEFSTDSLQTILGIERIS